MSDFWQDRRVLVTGASGLIGGWLVKALIEEAADVVCLVRDWVPHSHLLHHYRDNITIVRGDLSDAKALERIIAEYEIKSVIHLAAQTIVPIANKNPLSTYESNVAGTWNLLEACRLCPWVESVVIASSDKAYGDVPDLPYNESMPLRAVYPYDVSKACADMIGVSYAKTFNVPVGITRCGNFFGGGDLNWNRIIPGTIRSILRGQAPVIRSDGTLIRDYIYVEDAAYAYMLLSQRISEDRGLTGECFNFANETQKTVLDITNIILDRMNSDLSPVILGQVHGEIAAQYLDSSKAQRQLQWAAKYDLESALEKTISWYRNYFND